MASPELARSAVENSADCAPVADHKDLSLVEMAGQVLDFTLRQAFGLPDPAMECLAKSLTGRTSIGLLTRDLYSYHPGDAGYLSNVPDWTNVDIKAQYGFRKTENGFSANNIPGPDGTRYELDVDRSGERKPAQQVWRTDALGNRVPVTNPEVIKQVADAGNKMFDVWSSKNVLDELGLSDTEKQYVDRFMSAIKSQDTPQIQQMLSQYAGNTDRFGDLFVAMFCEQALRNMDGYHIGLFHQGDQARFHLTYPGASTQEFDMQ